MPLIWKLTPWKFWRFGRWGKWSQGQGHVPRLSKHWLSRYLPTLCLLLQILQLKDSWSTLFWSFSIPDSNWRDSRKHARGPWCPWTSSRRKYINGIFVLISCTVEIQEQKQNTSGKNLGIVWYSTTLDNLLPVQSCGCQIKGIQL